MLADDANWQIVYNTSLVRILTAGVVVREGVTYVCDTSAGQYTIDLSAGVDIFYIRDFGGTWTDANPLVLDVGTDTITFGTPAATGYTCIRSGTTLRAYGLDGTIEVGNI